jgi:hypothetical protein
MNTVDPTTGRVRGWANLRRRAMHNVPSPPRSAPCRPSTI